MRSHCCTFSRLRSCTGRAPCLLFLYFLNKDWNKNVCVVAVYGWRQRMEFNSVMCASTSCSSSLSKEVDLTAVVILRIDYDRCFPRHALVVLDTHWKSIELFLISTATSHTSIQHLGAQLDLPLTIVTNNGPGFCSEAFTFFIKNNGVFHLKSAHYHPSTTGFAKCAVQTLMQGNSMLRGSLIEIWDTK